MLTWISVKRRERSRRWLRGERHKLVRCQHSQWRLKYLYFISWSTLDARKSFTGLWLCKVSSLRSLTCIRIAVFAVDQELLAWVPQGHSLWQEEVLLAQLNQINQCAAICRTLNKEGSIPCQSSQRHHCVSPWSWRWPQLIHRTWLSLWHHQHVWLELLPWCSGWTGDQTRPSVPAANWWVLCWDWLIIVEVDRTTPDEDESTQSYPEQALHVLADCQQ